MMPFHSKFEVANLCPTQFLRTTTAGDKKTPIKREFNINWGTHRFREKLSEGAQYMIFYGQCELVD